MKNNTASLQTGNIIRVVTFGDAKLIKGGRAGIPVNRLYGRVTKRTSIVAEVSGPGRYEAKAASIGHEVKGGTPWYQWTSKHGIVSHPSGKEYLAVLSTDEVPTTEYFVDGNPATQGELSEIERFRSSSSAPLMLTLDLDKIQELEVIS